MDRLKSLKKRTEAASYAEVTKNAYRVYDMLVDLEENKQVFFVRDASGEMREMKIFI